MAEESTAPSTPTGNQRVEVVLRHELPRGADPPAAAPPKPPTDDFADLAARLRAVPPASAEEGASKKGKKCTDTVRLGEGDDFRQMSLDKFQERLAEESYRGRLRLLKEMGVKKEEREEILAALAEGRGAYKPVRSEDYEALEQARSEYEGAKPKLSRLDAYEQRLSKIADRELAALPEKARAQLEKRIPEGASAEERLAAIEEMQAILEELRPAGGAGEDDAAAKAKAEKDAAEAAAAAAAAKPPKPSNTGGPPGPAQSKAPGTLNELETYEDLKARAPSVAAAYLIKHGAKIRQLQAAREK